MSSSAEGGALAWHRRSAALLVPALVNLIPVFGYGSWRLRNSPGTPGMRVGLGATDWGLPQASITTETSIALAAARAYGDRIARWASQ